MNRLTSYAPVVLRIALSILFIWFGVWQLIDPSMWAGFVPAWVAGMMGGAITLVKLNGFAEIVLGLALLAGFQVRIVAVLLALHLFGIAGSIGFSPLGLRDFALAFATVSVALAGADRWSLDRRLDKLPGA